MACVHTSRLQSQIWAKTHLNLNHLKVFRLMVNQLKLIQLKVKQLMAIHLDGLGMPMSLANPWYPPLSLTEKMR